MLIRLRLGFKPSQPIDRYISGLTAQLYESLIDFLEERGVIQHKPFDAAPCVEASLDDIAKDKLRWFVTAARRERNMPLAASSPLKEVLTHLDLLTGEELTNAAVILFMSRPQRYLPAAIIKCAHFHGVEVEKPIPSHQVFEGPLFDQVDAAVDFVMARLRRSVGTRRVSAAAPVDYEIAREAVAEIIVNAAAHRDYTSTASVQVAVFADRVEVSNPGRLPPGLTPQDLRKPHGSEPPNPLIARPLYLAHYIESLGTGTLDVIRLCREADLPLPDFQQRGGQFVVTLWRDWLTEAALAGLGLEDRQIRAILGARATRRLTTAGYMEAAGVSRATAKRDLEALVALGLLVAQGSGRGAYYEIARNRPKNGSNGS